MIGFSQGQGFHLDSKVNGAGGLAMKSKYSFRLRKLAYRTSEATRWNPEVCPFAQI